jgi:hypothetical protein
MVNCQFEATSANFLAKYDYIPNPEVFMFPGRNNFGNSSLLLGEALLRMYWLYTTYIFHQQNTLQDNPYDKAWLNFSMNFKDSNLETSEISSPAFFSGSGQFFTLNSSGTVADSTIAGLAPVSDLIASGNHSILPAIWEPADALAKIFRDVIMVDMGQASPGNEEDRLVGNNLLTNTSYLEFFTKNFTQMSDTLKQAGSGWFQLSDDPDLQTAPFTSADKSRYQLGISPSTLGMSYICQVPQLKPSGALFFSVLVADLVIVQALWKLFQLVTDYFLMRKYPKKFQTANSNEAMGQKLAEIQGLRFRAPKVEL